MPFQWLPIALAIAYLGCSWIFRLMPKPDGALPAVGQGAHEREEAAGQQR